MSSIEDRPNFQIVDEPMIHTCNPGCLKVLVVDDDDAVLRLITKITSAAGYETGTARNGEEAWDYLTEHCPDLLITDWEMPKLDGIQLCRRLRESKLSHYVYVLLLTAKSHSEEMVQGLDAGADDFISKPINPSVLLARLKAGSRTVVMERRLRDVARFDPLTKTMNRRSFHELFEREWERAARYGNPLSCVMIDLDFFKRINDAYGHAAGDTVLQQVGDLLKTHCRSSDYVARYGGEEFCALLSETDGEGATAWAKRLCTALAQSPILHSGQALHVTCSLGVATRLVDTSGPEALVALADQALGAAKELGRNRVVHFSVLSDTGPNHLSVECPWANVRARDIMEPAVYCPNEKDRVNAVADAFVQLRLNAAPTLDDAGNLVGIISENDILARTVSPQGLDVTVRDCMKTDVVQYDTEASAKTILKFLLRAAVPRVVVVDGGRPVGVVSRTTLLRWLRNWAGVHLRDNSASQSTSELLRHSRILSATDAAHHCVAALRDYLTTSDRDFVTCALAEATRLEGVAQEILAHC